MTNSEVIRLDEELVLKTGGAIWRLWVRVPRLPLNPGYRLQPNFSNANDCRLKSRVNSQSRRPAARTPVLQTGDNGSIPFGTTGKRCRRRTGEWRLRRSKLPKACQTTVESLIQGLLVDMERHLFCTQVIGVRIPGGPLTRPKAGEWRLVWNRSPASNRRPHRGTVRNSGKAAKLKPS